MRHKVLLVILQVKLQSKLFKCSSISNIRGATSTVIELTVTPDSNDVVYVRDQIVEIDVSNSSITVNSRHICWRFC